MVEPVDETVLRHEWRDRPRPGDTVEHIDPVAAQIMGPGVVCQTFYLNGEGGMHVRYASGVYWTSCHRVRVVERSGEHG